MIEPGNGYWLRSSGEGSIVISEQGSASKRKIFPNRLQGSNILTINDHPLYFGITVPENEQLQYSLPPKPPPGAFDVRFSGDWKYCENDCEIEVLNTSGRLTVTYDLLDKDGQMWVLTAMNGRKYELEGSGEIIIPAEEKYFLTKTTSIPISYALHQNYPNPFNPVTNIRYDLKNTEHVTLTIFDLNGRKINQIVNTIQVAGHQSAEWNTTNSFGKPVSAGVYLYQIKAGQFFQTKKMILLK